MQTLRKLERPVTLADIPTAETMRKRQSAPRDFHKELRTIRQELEKAVDEGWKGASVYLKIPQECPHGYYSELIEMLENRGYKIRGGRLWDKDEYWLELSWK